MTRRLRRMDLLAAGLGLFLLALPAAAADPAPAPGETLWRETTRDVFVDGNLAPGAIVLRASDPARLLVLRDRADTSPIVLEEDSLELKRAPATDLTFGERGWEVRTTGEPRALPKGSARRIDDSTLLLNLPGGYLIVTGHAGTPGPTTRDAIFGQVPTWRELYDRYEPDAATVAALAAITDDVKLTLALGTWCGDSKREVPRLFKALDLAANPHLEVQSVALAGDFDDPGDVVRAQRLTNVPTLLVFRGGEEVGRIVETPAGESLADDLVRILAQAPPAHEGRWSRGARLARGRYTIRDPAGVERGIEDWELFADDEGGRLLHAWSDREGRATEVWHRRDAEGRSSFVEVTTTEGPWHRRSRHYVNDGSLRALTRGNGTGVIRQNATLDEGAVVVSPCVADLGRAAARAAVSQGPTSRPALLLGGAGQSPTGRLGTLELGLRGREPVTTAAGTFEATRVAGRFDGAFADGWLLADLNLAVRWRYASGDEALLESLETFAPAD